MWTSKAEEAFTKLKHAMTNLPVLALLDFNLPFEVTTDASSVAVGVVLSQQGHPIAYFSRKMCPRLCSSSAYVRELFAVTEAIKKWRKYLLGNTFRIYTDHKSLKTLLTQTIQTPKQQKWLTKLIGYNFEIHYKPGKENLVADALSRVLEASTGLCATVSSLIFPLFNQLQQFYATHPAGKQLITKLCESSTMQRNFSYRAGILYFQERIFIPREAAIIPSLLEEYHSSPLGGHSGIKATISRLSAVFYWPGMYADVKHFINSYSICHYNKYSTQPPYGLLQPLPVPQQVWEDISMDFVTNLHVSSNKTVIWVVVDRLTKYAHFIALPTHFTTSYLASMFLSEIHRLHGTLKTIVSDRDRIFISKFWKELFKSLGTTLAFSSSYHPQTDGQTEVLNRSALKHISGALSVKNLNNGPVSFRLRSSGTTHLIIQPLA